MKQEKYPICKYCGVTLAWASNPDELVCWNADCPSDRVKDKPYWPVSNTKDRNHIPFGFTPFKK